MNSLFHALLWLDVMVLRIVTLGRARPGETISSAAWSLYQDGKWQGKVLVPIIDTLFKPFMNDHCRKAWLWQKDIYK